MEADNQATQITYWDGFTANRAVRDTKCVRFPAASVGVAVYEYVHRWLSRLRGCPYASSSEQALIALNRPSTTHKRRNWRYRDAANLGSADCRTAHSANSNCASMNNGMLWARWRARSGPTRKNDPFSGAENL
jgi:hypothetical protein